MSRIAEKKIPLEGLCWPGRLGPKGGRPLAVSASSGREPPRIQAAMIACRKN